LLDHGPEGKAHKSAPRNDSLLLGLYKPRGGLW